MGAWIETRRSGNKKRYIIVAPFMGAWIETIDTGNYKTTVYSRTLHGCVD